MSANYNTAVLCMFLFSIASVFSYRRLHTVIYRYVQCNSICTHGNVRLLHIGAQQVSHTNSKGSLCVHVFHMWVFNKSEVMVKVLCV